MKPSENPVFVERYRNGGDIKEIAAELGIGMGTIRKWVEQAIKDGRLEARIRRWTEAETKTLILLYEGGESLEVIAQRLGRKRSGVEGKVTALRIKRGAGNKPVGSRVWTPEMESDLRKYVAQKMTDPQIGKRLKVTASSVANKRKSLGVASSVAGFSPWPEKETTRLVGLWPDYSIAEIARLMNRTNEQVRLKGLRLKLPSKSYPAQRKGAVRSYEGVAEANRRRAAMSKPKLVAKVVAPQVIPEHAKPWLERRFGECAYPYGERGNIHSCCKPVFNKKTWCEAHAGLCFDLRRAA